MTHPPAGAADRPGLFDLADFTPSVTASRRRRRSHRPVVLSYGLGVDSTAILLRWLTEPACRDFDLADLTVVTAMTGDEWDQTGDDVAAHVLPLLRRHQVRFVQVARARRHVSGHGDGVVTLDDSRRPLRVHLEGAYPLSQELLEAGTVPQSGGPRLCSVHAKGDVLDPTIAELTGGRPYRHVIGFEAGETRRADRDARYNTDVRVGEYPLIEWGWDRATAHQFVSAVTGADWRKSACSYCPYAMANRAGRAATFAAYRTHPSRARQALLMEHVAIALNPAQALVGRDRLADLLTRHDYHDVLDDYRRQLPDLEHAVYEVRRVLRPRRDNPAKLANASRSVRALAKGADTAMHAHLADIADQAGTTVATTHPYDVQRAVLVPRAATLPAVEHFYVAAPAVVADKTPPGFASAWAAATARPLVAA